jgi:Flp pilus assembly protein TadD
MFGTSIRQQNKRNYSKSVLIVPVWRVLRVILMAILYAASSPSGIDAQMGSPHQAKAGETSISVSVVDFYGNVIDAPAEVTLLGDSNSSGIQSVAAENGVAHFTGLAGGTYTVTAEVPGFKNGMAEVDARDFGVTEATVTMEPQDGSYTAPVAAGMFLAPKAKKDLEGGMAALRAGKYDEAQERFEEAYKLAPGNPDVNDVLGEFFLTTNHPEKSEEYLNQAASIDPDNINVLIDMGQLRIEQKNYAGAVVPLEKAVSVAPHYWFAHWLLGVSYLDTREDEKARVEANAAITTGKGKANDGEFLLGAALAALGRGEEAVGALKKFVRDLPHDAYVPSALQLIAKLQPSDAASAVASVGQNATSMQSQSQAH